MTVAREAPKPRLIDRVIGPSPRERHLELEVAAVEIALSRIVTGVENWTIDTAEGRVPLDEALRNIDLMLDAQGWTNIFEYEYDSGLTLRQLKEASRQLRELVVGNPFVANGARILTGSVWGGGLDFSARLRTGKQEARPLPADMQRLMEEPWAQRYLFGNKAHGELQRAAFTDGMIFILGRDVDKRFQRVQLQEICGAWRNPNNTEEVWAYRRSWNPNLDRPEAPTEEPRVRWYYTDLFPVEERRRTVRVAGGQEETAEVDYTILDFSFNRQIGWSFGVPDALCIVAWARLYREFLVNGYVMSRSLARLAYKVTRTSVEGAKGTSTTLDRPGQAGSAYIQGVGNDITPLSTAGRGYDFASGNGLAGAMAAGLGVSLLALLSNPAAATGSNAAAQTLDPIAKATAAVRRKEWEDDFVRTFRYFGMDRRLVTTWYDLPTDTLQRVMQALTLADQMEVFGPEIMQREAARALNIADPGLVPEGWEPVSKRGLDNLNTAGNAGATGGSGQGQNSRGGGSQDDHDDDE